MYRDVVGQGYWSFFFKMFIKSFQNVLIFLSTVKPSVILVYGFIISMRTKNVHEVMYVHTYVYNILHMQYNVHMYIMYLCMCNMYVY